MKRWNRWTAWICMLLVVALMSGCANAANYVKDTYPLVSADGKGKTTAKVYEAEGKTVPEVAGELAAQEKPQETSKEDPDQMFLIYDNRIVNLQKNPENAANTLIEIDSIEYAKSHYDSSFLEGYLTATLVQSIFGGDWWDKSYKKYSNPYKGYSTAVPSKSASPGSSSSTDEKKPTTTDRTGSFSSKGTTPSSGSSSGSASSGSSSGKSSTSTGSSSSSSSSSGSSGSSKSSGSWSTSSSGSVRKNDGSTPSTKSSSKPKTSSRSGSFSSKKR